MVNHLDKPSTGLRSSDVSAEDPYPYPYPGTLPQTGAYANPVEFSGQNPYWGAPNVVAGATVDPGNVIGGSSLDDYSFFLELTPGPNTVLMTYQWMDNNGGSGAQNHFRFSIYVLTDPT